MTFLDNHDQHGRFYYSPPSDPFRFQHQLTLGLACLFSLKGIPCLYYGTEQGLCSTAERYGLGSPSNPRYEWVRESLRGKPRPFAQTHPFYRVIQRLSALRAQHPALRRGQMCFRPVSENGIDFDYSGSEEGVLAYSRVLGGEEVVCVANTSTRAGWLGQIVVDAVLSPSGSRLEILFTSREAPAGPKPVAQKTVVSLASGETPKATDRLLGTVEVRLQPMEIQILRRARSS